MKKRVLVTFLLLALATTAIIYGQNTGDWNYAWLGAVFAYVAGGIMNDRKRG